jgi:hypothetical protein
VSAPDPAGRTSHDQLAADQRALIAALVSGAADPAGVDRERLAAARTALLAKRAGETARHWPMLARSLAPGWPTVFIEWATGQPSAGGLRDGWDFARGLAAVAELPALAAQELAQREVRWRYDGRSGPRPRRCPALRRTPTGAVVQVAGRVLLFRLRRA